MNATTVVTGANRGIGLATAQLLADQGHEVVGTGRTAPEAFPGTFYEVDFADSANLAAVGAEIADRHAVTGLVNNAGLSQARSVETVTMEDMDAHYRVNLRALVQVTQIMLPRLKAAEGGGRIVNIASRVVVGRAVRTPYVATKAALVGLTRSWALDLAPDGITVNCIAPGFIESPMTEALNEAQKGQILSTIPAGRLGTGDEIAASCVYLASAEAAYVTGQTLHVNGGMAMI